MSPATRTAKRGVSPEVAMQPGTAQLRKWTGVWQRHVAIGRGIHPPQLAAEPPGPSWAGSPAHATPFIDEVGGDASNRVRFTPVLPGCRGPPLALRRRWDLQGFRDDLFRTRFDRDLGKPAERRRAQNRLSAAMKSSAFAMTGGLSNLPISVDRCKVAQVHEDGGRIDAWDNGERLVHEGVEGPRGSSCTSRTDNACCRSPTRQVLRRQILGKIPHAPKTRHRSWVRTARSTMSV